MSTTGRSGSPSNKRATRSSLACAPCRYKHLRCDGTKPVCDRCRIDAKDCVYHASRRRGNPRPKALQTSSAVSISENSPATAPDMQVLNFELEPCNSSSINGEIPSQSPDLHLVGLYYDNFHAAHPCVLPQRTLRDRLGEAALQPLLLVVKYVGSIFDKSTPSDSYHHSVQLALSNIRSGICPVTGFDAQALLLYSIAIYWCNEPDQGVQLLEEAIRLAVDLGMHRKEFAVQNGKKDPVLEESWRRTWWQIYITDAHIAGSTHTFPFRTARINSTVDLPCEEDQYETGIIPQSKTLQDYDSREFFSDDDFSFSSYAQLIGLTRGIDQALSLGNTSDVRLYANMCANADTSVRAWHSLLPSSKRTLVRPDGSVDEVMFKAQFIMHTYTVEVHRPLSSLTYSPIEAISRCAPLAPSETLSCSNLTERELHTTKCLAAIDKLDHLLTLPTNMKSHSPFIICMIANVTIAHLSACRFVLGGERLTTSREKIRLTMGTLKRLSEYWILGKRTYREIGMIAREILCLDNDKASISEPPVPPASTEEFALDFSASDMLPGLNFDFCTFFDSHIPGMTDDTPRLIL